MINEYTALELSEFSRVLMGVWNVRLGIRINIELDTDPDYVKVKVPKAIPLEDYLKTPLVYEGSSTAEDKDLMDLLSALKILGDERERVLKSCSMDMEKMPLLVNDASAFIAAIAAIAKWRLKVGR